MCNIESCSSRIIFYVHVHSFLPNEPFHYLLPVPSISSCGIVQCSRSSVIPCIDVHSLLLGQPFDNFQLVNSCCIMQSCCSVTISCIDIDAFLFHQPLAKLNGWPASGLLYRKMQSCTFVFGP